MAYWMLEMKKLQEYHILETTRSGYYSAWQELYYAELSRQDVFYEQFVNEGAESASSLIFSYCTMINYGEYAGICALSEGIEYSEELQKSGMLCN